MVRLIGLVWIALSLPLQAAQLRVELDKPQVEVGKYLNARIIYIGQQAVGLANLQQWENAFVIDRRDHESESLLDGQIRSTEKLRLYPRNVGEALLESIALGGTKATPQRVTVLPAVRQGIDSTPQWQAVPKHLWQGQTIELQIKIALLHPSNFITAEDAEFPGFETSPLKSQDLQHAGVHYKVMRWQVHALQPGVFTIDAPAIEQRGRGRWRYYLPLQRIEVFPLPAYLPASVPVGQPNPTATIVDDQYWEVRYAENPPVSEHPYGLYTGLANAAARPVSAVKLIATSKDSGSKFQVALPDWSFGPFSQTTLSLPYFDTQLGQLRHLSLVLPSPWRMPLIAKIIIGLMALLGVVAGYFLLHPVIAQWRLRRKVRQIMATPLHPCAKRKALLALSDLQTLQELSAHWPFVKPADLQALDKACFGDTTTQLTRK